MREPIHRQHNGLQAGHVDTLLAGQVGVGVGAKLAGTLAGSFIC